MKEKGLSKGEFQSVCQAIGGYDKPVSYTHLDVYKRQVNACASAIII